MPSIVTVLVAGNETLYLDLSEQLVGACRVIHCDTIGEALDRAPDAAVVVVEAAMFGGDDLCRRLRADPMAAGVPVLLRASPPFESDCADEVIPPALRPTMEALARHCPELAVGMAPSDAANPQAIADSYFDLDESTVEWRHSLDQEEWPQPPPSRDDAEDLLTFTQAYAGYVNSLVEGHQKPTSLTSSQQRRLQQMSQLVLEQEEAVLSTTQQGVNQALRAKDLMLMRELSLAKTALFEKQQHLRSLVPAPSKPSAEKPQGTETALASSKERAPIPAPSTAAAASALTPTGTTPGVGKSLAGQQPTVKPQKSQLTLAAERKAVARSRKRKAQLAARKPERDPTRRTHGASRRAAAKPVPLVTAKRLLVVGILLVLGSAAWALLRSHPAKVTSTTPDNARPKMKFVTIQQTPAGIVARPEANDPENDPIVYTISWFVDGQPVPQARTARLLPRFYRPGQVVETEVTPADNYGKGQPMRSQKLTVEGDAKTDTPQTDARELREGL